jgi:membrane protein DedA with SNARE-associated domain
MSYGRFIVYNIVGGVGWVLIFVLGVSSSATSRW